MTSLQVIGAGLGRTGTLSLKLALEDLGFGPCHHMVETFQQMELNYLWKDVLEENNKDDALKAIFEGFKASIDYPGCMFFEKFASWNPDAKVILSVRDSPEAWAVSCRDTIFSTDILPKGWYDQKDIVFPSNPIFQLEHMQCIFRCMVKTHGVDPYDADTSLAKMYTDWKQHVIDTVSADNLLVFNVKEGWEPLCKFLGVPVPEKEFPKTNSTEDFKNRIKSMAGEH